jgi:hypothetical protein
MIFSNTFHWNSYLHSGMHSLGSKAWLWMFCSIQGHYQWWIREASEVLLTHRQQAIIHSCTHSPSFYKLNYIKLTWGSAEEQVKEHAAGNINTKNWQDEVQKIIGTVMEEYYKKHPRAEPVEQLSPSSKSTTPFMSISSDYDWYRQTLVLINDNEEWVSELRQSLKKRPANIIDTNSCSGGRYVHFWYLNPTLTSIALDVLPCQASSVPCEHLFSVSKQAADDHWASLGAKHFEELQVLKFAWHKNITNLTAWNMLLEKVNIDEYCEMLMADEAGTDFEGPQVELVFEDWD